MWPETPLWAVFQVPTDPVAGARPLDTLVRWSRAVEVVPLLLAFAWDTTHNIRTKEPRYRTRNRKRRTAKWPPSHQTPIP
jgi:hypothetical protein